MKKPVTFIILFFSCLYTFAQNNNVQLIPRRIFVGDQATLIINLPAASEASDVILTSKSPDFPQHENIDFHNILLENRAGGSRLIIEFTAFAPGLLEFPFIEIGNERFFGLTVTVSSVMENISSPALSMPASSLAMPGTALMIYGTMAGIVIIIFIAVWFFVKGKTFLNVWIKKIIRWQNFALIKNMEKRLRKAVLKGIDKRIILDNLSDQFRKFLSYLTDKNCLSMTSQDFKRLPPTLPATQEFSPLFLGDFFRACDKLRFSGAPVDSNEVLKLLAELRHFLIVQEKAKKVSA